MELIDSFSERKEKKFMEKLEIYQQQNHVLLKFGDSALLKAPQVLSIKPPKTKCS